MRWNRGIASWLLVCLIIAGGIVTLAVLPMMLTATTTSNLNTVTQPEPPLPPDPSGYEPAVLELIETTYLGRSKEFPDPGEPAVVLQKYLEQNAHGYHQQLVDNEPKLDTELAAWQTLVQLYPQSRHALAGLAKHYRTKATVSGNIDYIREAADAFIQAAEIGLTHGRIRYTRELSELLVGLGDRDGLDALFGRMLAQPKNLDRDYYYLALVDYADGLARLSDDRAGGYFEQAITFHPENNLEAINRYARYLLDRGQAQKALEVLDTRLTSEQRVRFVLPVQLRKEAMESLGLDTAPAEAEIAQIEQRLSEGAWGLLPVDRRSQVTGTETSVPALAVTSDTDLSTLFAPATASAITADSRISTLFATPPDTTTTTTDERIIKQDAIFSPTGVPNNRWLNMSPTQQGKKLTTLRWPNGTAGLVRIGTDNAVHYRYFNGTSWQAWQSLGGSAVDITAVVYNNGQADIFRTDGCNIYNSHSVNGQTFGGWTWWGACGDEIAAAIMPNGKGWFALRATGAGNQAVVRYYNGSQWDVSSPVPWTALGGVVKDLTLLAYANPAAIGGIAMTLFAVWADNSTIAGWNFNGTSWAGPATWTSGYKNVSAFNTSDGGAYVLYLGTSNSALYTQRFTGTGWGGVAYQGVRQFIAAAGVNIDDDTGNAYEHTEANDDCRVKHYSSGPVCDNSGNCFWTQGVNLAEIIYNEARGETPGARDTVGWTVRDRAFEGLSNPTLCGSYVGAEGGGTLTAACRDPNTGVPCNQSGFCDNTPRYCCVMHGGQTKLGTAGYQFNDEHVDINTLSSSGVIWEAFYVGNGWVGDVSTQWCPPGVSGCSFACSGPGSTSGSNFNDPSPHGPMEFQSSSYPVPNSSCQQAPTINTCPSCNCPAA